MAEERISYIPWPAVEAGGGPDGLTEEQREGLEERLDEAASRFGEQAEALMEQPVSTRGEVDAALDQADAWMDRVSDLEQRPRLAALGDLELYAVGVDASGKRAREAAIRRNRGTDKSASQRQREYEAAEYAGREAAASGVEPTPPVAVIRRWLLRDDNYERLMTFRERLEQVRFGLDEAA